MKGILPQKSWPVKVSFFVGTVDARLPIHSKAPDKKHFKHFFVLADRAIPVEIFSSPRWLIVHD